MAIPRPLGTPRHRALGARSGRGDPHGRARARARSSRPTSRLIEARATRAQRPRRRRASTRRAPRPTRPTRASPPRRPAEELPPLLGVPVHDQGVVRASPGCPTRRARSRRARRRRRPRRATAVARLRRRRRDPARRHQHVRADDVDRVATTASTGAPTTPTTRAHRRRLVGRRGRRGRRRRRADRPRHRHRRLDPPAGVLQRRLRPQADAAAWCRTPATTRPPNERGRAHARPRARSPAAPRT